MTLDHAEVEKVDGQPSVSFVLTNGSRISVYDNGLELAGRLLSWAAILGALRLEDEPLEA